MNDILEKISAACPQWSEIDIFDMHSEFQEGHCFIAKYPNYLSLEDYIQKIISSVLLKNPAIILCDKKIYPHIQHINKIVLDAEEIDIIVDHKYSQRPKKIIGITGSFGKTSTAFFLHQFLNYLQYPALLLSSIGCGVENLNTMSLSCNTNIALKRYLHKNAHCQFAIMEITSHSIDQNRIRGIFIDYCIFSGFLVDHVDYHGSIEKYLETKLKFWNSVHAVKIIHESVPIDKQNYSVYPSESIYVKEDFIYIYDISIKINNLNSISEENVLAAIYLLYKININIEKLNNYNLKNPQGRLELIGQTIYGAKVYNDGAHSKEQVELMLSKIKFDAKKTYIIYGVAHWRLDTDLCAGKILSKYGNTIITDDDPGHINPATIRSSILSYDKNLIEIPHRFQAINYCLEEAKAEDNILILGKSSEVGVNKIRYNGYTIYYNESVITKQLIQNQILDLAKKSM